MDGAVASRRFSGLKGIKGTASGAVCRFRHIRSTFAEVVTESNLDSFSAQVLKYLDSELRLSDFVGTVESLRLAVFGNQGRRKRILRIMGSFFHVLRAHSLCPMIEVTTADFNFLSPSIV